MPSSATGAGAGGGGGGGAAAAAGARERDLGGHMIFFLYPPSRVLVPTEASAVSPSAPERMVDCRPLAARRRLRTSSATALTSGSSLAGGGSGGSGRGGGAGKDGTFGANGPIHIFFLQSG